ncbi:L-2-hydroxyglutarate oxidase [Pseudonocardiaceae bacterium YIM PH 21723]|nr:L-2-hydroxyglutarate oxidase [Pseudonocardiaceae bacterium YIM PH 21723]
MRQVVIIGGGIIGLAVARELAGRYRVVLLEKENRWAAHQTGHNSGVIHAGLYYKPGSAKARMCVAGAASMVEFAEANDIPVQVCGKLVVATEEAELPALRTLHERAEANGVPARLLTAEEAREYEPEVACVAALRVESTGIIDYAAVCRALADDLDADLRLNTRVTDIFLGRIDTTAGDFTADLVINCAGLHSDRIARLAGLRPSAKIVPFRGEYYELAPERRDLVRGLIYPVPNPAFPFLGVHLTRMIDGSVHAGPNAVLALAREGYRWRDVSPRDLGETLAFPGFWRLAAKNLGEGIGEVSRSLSKARFAKSLARLVPAVTSEDIVPAGAGVRAQAMLRNGGLVDDFLIDQAPGQIHVLNAPSPAATSSLEIAKHIGTLAEAQLA